MLSQDGRVLVADRVFASNWKQQELKGDQRCLPRDVQLHDGHYLFADLPLHYSLSLLLWFQTAANCSELECTVRGKTTRSVTRRVMLRAK
jgi:hypothetical protein